MSLNTIWKFPLIITDRQLIEVPLEARLLHVGLDPSDEVCIWMAVDTDSVKRDIEIVVRGTGHTLGQVGSFLGSVVQGSFVWHVFTGPNHSLQRARELHHLSLKVNG